MDLADLFSRALQDGCGKSLEELLVSDMYWSLVGQLSAEPQKEDERLARQVGPEQFSLLLASFTEGMALARARLAEPVPSVSPEIMAALQLTGEEIIIAAVDCLPDIVRQLAAGFSSATADQQLEGLRWVFNLFSKTARYAKYNRLRVNADPELVELLREDGIEIIDVDFPGESSAEPTAKVANVTLDESTVEAGSQQIVDQLSPSTDDAQPKGQELGYDWLDRYDRKYTGDEALPLQLGRWAGDGLISPSCLGLSIILAAFAHCTGSPYLHVYQLQDHSSVIAQYRGQDAELWLEDLDQRQFSVKPQYIENERRWSVRAKGITQTALAAHYAIAIRLSDGRWVHIDPYLGNFAVFQDCWKLEEKYRLLTKYQTALPGLSLIGQDHGALRRHCQEISRHRSELLAASATLQQRWDEFRHNQLDDPFDDLSCNRWIDEYEFEPYELAEKCEEDVSGWDRDSVDLREMCDDSEAAMLLDCLHYHPQLKKSASSCLFYVYGVRSLVDLEQQGLTEDQIVDCYAAKIIQFDYDPVFRAECLERFFTLFHLFSIDLGSDLMELAPTEGRFPNPALEFALPSFSIGLAVVNNLRCCTEPRLPGTLLLGYSSSQHYWMSAADLSVNARFAEDPRIRWSEEVVRKLPVHNPAIKCKLEYLDRFREEHSGPSIQSPEASRRDQGLAGGRQDP